MDDFRKYKNAHEWLMNNDPIPYLLEIAGKMHIGDEELLLVHLLSAHILGLSEKVDPVHIYTVGQSGKGKGHTANTILKLFPREMIVPLASFSSKSFFYANKEDLESKIIHCPEISAKSNDEDKLGLLRILTDSPNSNLQAEHWTIDDKRKPLKLKLTGRHVFWFNSVVPLEDDQIKNRVLMGNPDESGAQDNRVYDLQQRKLAFLDELVSEDELKFCQEINKKILEDKEPDVIIPFAPFFEIPKKDNRRLNTSCFNLIKAITKMRFYKRESVIRVGNGKSINALLATPEDVELGIWVVNKMYPTTTSQVSKQALQILEYIPPTTGPGITKTELADITHQSTDTCYRRCRELYSAGLIRMEKVDRQLVYWRDESQGKRINSEIRVSWEMVTEKALLDVFQKIPVRIEDMMIVEEFCRNHSLYQKSFPIWLTTRESNKALPIPDLNSENRENPSSRDDEKSYLEKPVIESEFV